MEETYDISEVLKSLQQMLVISFLGLHIRNEMRCTRKKAEATHTECPKEHRVHTGRAKIHAKN
jgi:hypothetical protein